MKKYLEYNEKVHNYEDIGVTVKTIEQVAASKIHGFRKMVVDLNEYTTEITTFLTRLAQYYHDLTHPLLQKRENGKKVLLIITSDKGLVGALYHSIISTVIDQKNNYDVIHVIGNRGRRYLQEEKIPLSDPFFSLSDIPTPEEIEKITEFLFSLYTTENILLIDVLHPSFISLAEQTPLISPFLPFVFTDTHSSKLEQEKDDAIGFPIFESSKKSLYQSLLQKYIHSIFYKIIIDAKLAEFAARTVAMEHASAKIKISQEQLALEYFKERRTSTTQKQLENFTVHTLL